MEVPRSTPWYRPRLPANDLRDIVLATSSATVEGHHDMIPDGSVELLWIEGRGVWLCGPDTAAWSFELPAGTACATVRFRPGASGPFIGLPTSEIVDLRVPLDEVFGGPETRRLDEMVGVANDDAGRMAAIESFVRNRRQATLDEPIAHAAALLGRSSRPAGGLAGLADTCGYSTRQFRRRFARAVGYSPAYFARVARLNRFLGTALGSHRPRLADLAAGVGYSDQSHLSRDCMEIARMTPRRLLDVADRTSAARPRRCPIGTRDRCPHGGMIGA